MTTQVKLTPQIIGDGRTLTATFTDDLLSGALDLSGYDVKFRMWGPTGSVDKEIGTGITVLTQTGATKGKCEIVIDEADTLPFGLAPGMIWDGSWPRPSVKVSVEMELRKSGVPSTPITGSVRLLAQGVA